MKVDRRAAFCRQSEHDVQRMGLSSVLNLKFDGLQVEFLVPYDHRPEDIAARLQRHNLTQALFNLPPGDWAAGERGLAALPERAAEFRASVETALRYALATRVKRLHVMSGTADRHDHAAMTAYRAALAFACEAAAVHQIDVVIELINAWTCRVIFSII